jgi:hypothetical protein
VGIFETSGPRTVVGHGLMRASGQARDVLCRWHQVLVTACLDGGACSAISSASTQSRRVYKNIARIYEFCAPAALR